MHKVELRHNPWDPQAALPPPSLCHWSVLIRWKKPLPHIPLSREKQDLPKVTVCPSSHAHTYVHSYILSVHTHQIVCTHTPCLNTYTLACLHTQILITLKRTSTPRVHIQASIVVQTVFSWQSVCCWYSPWGWSRTVCWDICSAHWRKISSREMGCKIINI